MFSACQRFTYVNPCFVLITLFADEKTEALKFAVCYIIVSGIFKSSQSGTRICAINLCTLYVFPVTFFSFSFSTLLFISSSPSVMKGNYITFYSKLDDLPPKPNCSNTLGIIESAINSILVFV